MIKIEEIKKEYQEILEKLKNIGPSENWGIFAELSQKKDFLKNILEKYENIEILKKKIRENEKLLNEKGLASIAEEEIVLFKKKIIEIENEIDQEIKKERGKDRESKDSLIIEIRAGTGGNEAALFVADLFDAYTKYANNKGWNSKILNSNQSTIGGYKEVIFEIDGEDAYSKMQNEAGVHRVQRVPKTEKTGRIHTSTISVAVLPKPKKSESKIRESDLKIDLFRSSGAGGMNVNARATAVRITHIPTGIVVASQTSRSQPANRENAMALLEAKLLEKEREEMVATSGDIKKDQIKKAERSDKIRTYNYPQNRITDHRIGKSWHNLDEIMQGKMECLHKHES